MNQSSELHPQWILPHAEWVHRLARRLVEDAETADDLSQDTLAQALERPPRDDRSIRGWLATVVHNLARKHARTEQRRERRERWAGLERVRREEDVQTRAELQQSLVECVLQLDSPYRQVILHRYLDGLSIDEVAHRMGCPRNTVRSQLHRGLGKLRERWERDRGRGSVLALVPLAALTDDEPWATGSTSSTTGSWIARVFASTSLKAAAVLIVAASAWWAFDTSRSATEPASGSPSSVAGSRSLREPSPTTDAPALVQRSAVISPPVESNQPRTARVPIEEDRPQVVDASGRAIAGLEFVGEDRDGDRWTGTSDDEGYLDRVVVLRSETPVPIDDRWIAIAYGNIAAGDRKGQPILVVAPAVTLAGRVQAPGGNGIRGARVEVSVMREALLQLPYRLAGFDQFRTWVTYSGQTGHFDLGRVPCVEGFPVKSWGDGWQEATLPVPNQAMSDLAIHLQPDQRFQTEARILSGRVVDRHGSGVSGASVDFGFDSTKSGTDGRFRLRVTGGVQDWVLTAMVRGSQAAVYHGLAARLDAGEEEIRDLRLQLGGPPKTIEGRILDAAGQPRENVSVFLRDGTMYGSWGHPIEFEVSGTTGVCLQTDAEGRFEFGGLSDRDYWILACDSDDMLVLESKAVPAGTKDLVLREPEDARTTLSGIVRSPDGTPLDGIEVALEALVLDTGFSGMLTSGREVSTDENGRFRLEKAPWRGLALVARADDIVETRIDLTVEHTGENAIELEVLRRHRLILNWQPGGADAVALLDRHGDPQTVTVFASDGTNSRELIQSSEYPRGARCEIDDTVTTIAGYRDGREQWRRGIEPKRGVELEIDL